MNYYQRHIGDYAKDTGHLSLLEHGVYSSLLDWIYSTEKQLPDDLQAIYRICRAHSKSEKKAVDSVVCEFFIAADGFRKNKRAEIEIAWHKQVKHQRSIGGVLKNNPTWTREQADEYCKTHAQALDVHMLKHMKSSATRARTNIQYPISNIQIEGGAEIPAQVQPQSDFPEVELPSVEEIYKFAAEFPGNLQRVCRQCPRNGWSPSSQNLKAGAKIHATGDAGWLRSGVKNGRTGLHTR